MNSPPPVPKKPKTKYPKIFQCTGYGDCRMTFTRSEHLARHIRKHTGERPFRCHCGKTFSRLDNLRQHIQTVHANDHHILHAPLPPPPMPQGELQVAMGQAPISMVQGQPQMLGHIPSPMVTHPHATYQPQMYDYQYPLPPQPVNHSSEESLPSSINSSQSSLQTPYSPQACPTIQRKRRPAPLSTENHGGHHPQQHPPLSPSFPTTPTNTHYTTHSAHNSLAGIPITDMPPVVTGQRPPSLGGDGDSSSIFSSPFQTQGNQVRTSVSSTNSISSVYNYPMPSSNLTTPLSANQPGNTNSWLSSVLCTGQESTGSNRLSSASSSSASGAFSQSSYPDDDRPRTWGPSTNTLPVSTSPHQQYRGSGILTGDAGIDSGRQSLSSLVINESMDESDDDMTGTNSEGAPSVPIKDKPLPPFSSLINAATSPNRPQILVNKSYTKNLILPRPDSYPPKPPGVVGPTEFGDFTTSHVLPMADMRPVPGQYPPQSQARDKPLPPLPREAADVEMSNAPQRDGMDYLLEAASLSSRA